MKKWRRYAFAVWIILFFCTIVFLIVVGFNTTGDTRYRDNLRPLRIMGKYSVNGGEWKTYGKGTEFTESGIDYIVICGHFSENVNENKDVFLNIHFLKVNIKINGEEVYRTKDGQNTRYLMNSVNAWESFATNRITAEDEIEITLTAVYKTISAYSMNICMTSLCMGSQCDLYNIMYQENGLEMLIGLFFISIGIILFIVSSIAMINKIDDMEKGIALGILIFLSGIWYFSEINSEFMSLLIKSYSVRNLIDYILIYIYPWAVAVYFTMLLKNKAFIQAASVILMAFLVYDIAIFLLHILRVSDLYNMQNSIILPMVLAYIIIFFLCVEAVKTKDKKTIMTLITFLTTLIGALVQCFQYITDSIHMKGALALGIILSLVLQLVLLIDGIKKRAAYMKNVRNMENEMMQKNISLMLSQIQPHFLYNSLTAIRSMCVENPEGAEEAVTSFAKYLRGNMDMLTKTELIPFRQELNHIKAYIHLEQIRLGEQITIVFDIKTDTFMVPALTVQTLVENAIHHGIGKKIGGGTVTISTREENEAYIVVVADDGVGFDMDSESDGKRSHIGIENTVKRLNAMCKGKLEIVSTLGIGTAVTIIVPKGEEQ